MYVIRPEQSNKTEELYFEYRCVGCCIQSSSKAIVIIRTTNRGRTTLWNTISHSDSCANQRHHIVDDKDRGRDGIDSN